MLQYFLILRRHDINTIYAEYNMYHNSIHIYTSAGYMLRIGRMENMEYDADEDYYTCRNGKKLTVTGVKKQKLVISVKKPRTAVKIAADVLIRQNV